MNPKCPQCLSSAVDRKDLARKVGSSVGLALGTTAGAATAIGSSDIRSTVDAVTSPWSIAAAGLATALLGVITGAAAGTIAGSALGSSIDENILHNYRCLSCEFEFSHSR